jgi:hypothetical protein
MRKEIWLCVRCRRCFTREDISNERSFFEEFEEEELKTAIIHKGFCGRCTSDVLASCYENSDTSLDDEMLDELEEDEEHYYGT